MIIFWFKPQRQIDSFRLQILSCGCDSFQKLQRLNKKYVRLISKHYILKALTKALTVHQTLEWRMPLDTKTDLSNTENFPPSIRVTAPPASSTICVHIQTWIKLYNICSSVRRKTRRMKSITRTPAAISHGFKRYSQYDSAIPSATWHMSTAAAPSLRTPRLTSVNSLNNSMLVLHASSCSYPNPVIRSALSTYSKTRIDMW